MITDNKINYEHEDENLLYEGETLKPFENENQDTVILNALNPDEFEDDPDENDSEEGIQYRMKKMKISIRKKLLNPNIR
ncbi:hypothetical protein [Flavobacterium seoulense]|uniref:Uncharacterized protein n=1 Tax=Flavobacterium seoulense TaxID=1492738 RepID=A0A066WNV7_9FLAO|nr:hypothetical protein [Flavobacterium seoulense]KDN55536.1 hypothetical protein FEM21_14190 [Flavobacterium seoulense]